MPSRVNVYAQAGDRVCWRQYNVTAVGGVNFAFDSGNQTAWRLAADHGQQMNQDFTQGGWQQRCGSVPSWLYGDRLNNFQILHDVASPNGSWTMMIADLIYLQANGNVVQLFTSGIVPFAPGGGGDPTGGTIYATVEDAVIATDSSESAAPPGASTHYLAGDQVGTVQMELSSGGWPTWKGEFAPFGQQLDSNPSANRYKFTGKERDTESGLDYFGARYYASSMGRWMSPDWSDVPDPVPYAEFVKSAKS